jgi:hypothetical protein
MSKVIWLTGLFTLTSVLSWKLYFQWTFLLAFPALSLALPSSAAKASPAAKADEGYGHPKPKCHTEYTTIYETIYKDKCEHYYDKKCHTEYDTKYKTEYKKDCHVNYESKCHTTYITKYDKKCETYYSEEVSSIPTFFI